MRILKTIVFLLFSLTAYAQQDIPVRQLISGGPQFPSDTANLANAPASWGKLYYNKNHGYWVFRDNFGYHKLKLSGASATCLPSLNPYTSSHTLVVGDVAACNAVGLMRFTGSSANIVTVPTNATAALPLKSQIVILNQGTQKLVVAWTGGTTHHSVSDTVQVGASAVLFKNNTNDWDLYGGAVTTGSGGGISSCFSVTTNYTASHAVGLADFSTCNGEGIMRFSGTGINTLTVNTNATTAIPLNYSLGIINEGTNNITVSFAVGVNHNEVSLVITPKASAFLFKAGTDTWDLLGTGSAGGGITSVVAGTGIGVDNTDPNNPIISNTGVLSVTAGTNITVNNTDPKNPIISGSGASGTVTSVGLTTGSTGTAPNVSGSPVTTSGTITFNIPLAGSGVTSGTTSNGTQSIYGAKTYINDAIFNTKVGIGSTPTAKLHIGGGTTAAGTAPMKFTTGALMTTPENGSLEYDGTHLYFTRSGLRYQLEAQNTLLSNGNGTTISGSSVNIGGSQATDILITSTNKPFTWTGNSSSAAFNVGADGGVNLTGHGGGVLLRDDASGGILLDDVGGGGVAINATGQLTLGQHGSGGTQITNSDNTSYIAIQGQDASNAPGTEIRIGSTQAKFTDSRPVQKGFEYNADYSANFTSRSLVDKAYVDAAAASAPGGFTQHSVPFANASGVLTEDNTNFTYNTGTGVMYVGPNTGAGSRFNSTGSVSGTFSGLNVQNTNASTANTAEMQFQAGGAAGKIRIYNPSHSLNSNAFEIAAIASFGNIRLNAGTAGKIQFLQNSTLFGEMSAAGFTVGSGATPTARLMLPAGTATSSTAPVKFTSGTALATPENGAMEFHGSHLWITIGSTRYQLDQQAAGGTVTGVTGTTNRITSSGGTTPAIDISSSYVGQPSITTLGTIGTGTWNGTAIGISKGGSGQTALGSSLQVLRTNSAATGTEWATVGTGITNSAANNEIMRSDGTNATPSGVFVGTGALGSMTLGSGSISGDRTETISSSTSTAGKHTILHGSAAIWDLSTDAGGSNGSLTFEPGIRKITVGDNTGGGQVVGGAGIVSQNNGQQLSLVGGAAYTGSGNGNGGELFLAGGSSNGTGKNGAIRHVGATRYLPTSYTPLSAGTINVDATTTFLYVDCTNGNQIIVLPDGASNPYRYIVIRRTDSSVNTMTIRRSGSDTMNGSATDRIYIGAFKGGDFHNMTGGAEWVVVHEIP